MSRSTHSREATAAERFVQATRRVDVAFRAVRGEVMPQCVPIRHSLAVFQLEKALEELAEAQDFFDAAVDSMTPKQTS